MENAWRNLVKEQNDQKPIKAFFKKKTNDEALMVERNVDIVNNNSFLAAVEEKGKIFNLKLNKLKARSNLISEIRGLGLMIGIQFNIDSSIVANKLFEKNLLTVGAGDNVIRLLPPLNISKSEIDEVIDILDITLREIQANG